MSDFSWKDVANALSLANMILGLFSIFCSFCKKSSCASWMLLISFLLDMAVGAVTRHLNICSKSGAELNDFAVFTTFGLASALLLGVDGPLNGFLAAIYVLAIAFRLCFYSTGTPFTYKGLPCSYASCVLASTSLLTKGNTFILSCMASLMILFMMDQSYYPHDEVLESENWKKMVYLGGPCQSQSRRSVNICWMLLSSVEIWGIPTICPVLGIKLVNETDTCCLRTYSQCNVGDRHRKNRGRND